MPSALVANAAMTRSTASNVSSRMIWPRDAPSDARTASSRVRRLARTSCRLATFAHPIASTVRGAESISTYRNNSIVIVASGVSQLSVTAMRALRRVTGSRGLDAAGQRQEFCREAFAIHRHRQPAIDIQPPLVGTPGAGPVAHVRERHVDGEPRRLVHLAAAETAEALRRDPGDDRVTSADHDRLSHDVGRRAQARGPERVRDHHRQRRIRPIVGRMQQPAEMRPVCRARRSSCRSPSAPLTFIAARPSTRIANVPNPSAAIAEKLGDPSRMIS